MVGAAMSIYTRPVRVEFISRRRCILGSGESGRRKKLSTLLRAAFIRITCRPITKQKLYLREEDVKPPHDADNMYGWAKLMAELTLQAYYPRTRSEAASCRVFHSVRAARSGKSRCNGNDPLGLLSARIHSMSGGDGTQIRNWTYVDDIVSGNNSRR